MSAAVELFDALRRLFGALTSSVDERFLLGRGAGDDPRGDMPGGDPAFGGDAMVVGVTLVVCSLWFVALREETARAKLNVCKCSWFCQRI